MLCTVKEKEKHQKPSDVTVYSEMTHHNSCVYPCDLKQCQNTKSRQITQEKEKKNNNKRKMNVVDKILNLIERISEDKFVAEIMHSRNDKPCSIICYTDVSLEDLCSFTSYQIGIVGIDHTFNLGQCFVILTV